MFALKGNNFVGNFGRKCPYKFNSFTRNSHLLKVMVTFNLCVAKRNERHNNKRNIMQSIFNGNK